MNDISRGELVEIVKDAKKKSIGYGIFTLIAIVVLLVGAVIPTISTISKIIAEVEQKKVVNKQLNDKILALTALKKQYNSEVKDAFEDVSLVFPDSGDFSLLVVNIEEISKMNSFEVESISFSEPNAVDQELALTITVPWNVNISVVGDRSNLIGLLSDLEAMPSYSQIDGLSFATPSTDGEQMSFNIVLKVYKIINPDFY